MSGLKVTFLGQSCFLLADSGISLLIDPGTRKSGDNTANAVYVTHGHSDHVAGVKTFLEKNPKATLICNSSVARKFAVFKDRISEISPGDKLSLETWNLRFADFRHGLFKGEHNTGVIVDTGNVIFGHVGDAIEYSGFYHEKITVLAHPISGIVTTSPKKGMDELSKFTDLPESVIPMHWLFRSPKGYCKKFNARFTGSRCIIPEKGAVMNFP